MCSYTSPGSKQLSTKKTHGRHTWERLFRISRSEQRQTWFLCCLFIWLFCSKWLFYLTPADSLVVTLFATYFAYILLAVVVSRCVVLYISHEAARCCYSLHVTMPSVNITQNAECEFVCFICFLLFGCTVTSGSCSFFTLVGVCRLYNLGKAARV